MPESLAERMREKGWSEEEIKNALNKVYSPEKEEKHIEYKKEMNKVVYWTTLLVLTVANFLVSIVLIPFLLVLKPYQLGMIVAVMGLVLGLLFNLVIRDVEHIETKHHVVAAIFIPSVALINVFVMVSIGNSLSQTLGIAGHENPVLISLAYICAFLVPYIISEFREARRRLKKNRPKKSS